MADELKAFDPAFTGAAEVRVHLIARARVELVDVEIEIDGLDRAGRRLARHGLRGRSHLKGLATVALAALIFAAIAIARTIIGDLLAAAIGTSLTGRAMAVNAAFLALTVDTIFPGVAVFIFFTARVFRTAADEKQCTEEKEKADANGHDGELFPRDGLELIRFPRGLLHADRGIFVSRGSVPVNVEGEPFILNSSQCWRLPLP